ALASAADSGDAPVVCYDVALSYDDAPVLVNVRFDIEAGKTLAIVGPTASGKSTFALLMARLWDPSTGRITLDGRDLRTFARSELPREVAYVSQEAFLFDASVRDTITLGEDFTDADVWEA